MVWSPKSGYSLLPPSYPNPPPLLSKQLFPTPFPATQPHVLSDIGPDAIDGHFHLDRLSARVSLAPLWSLDHLGGAAPVQAPFRVKLVGAVANYCDPGTYPSLDKVRDLAALGVTVAIGCHPKTHRTLSAEVILRLRNLFHSQYVTAVGEVGLDATAQPFNPSQQIDVVKQFLKFLSPHGPKKVLILHCRPSLDPDLCPVTQTDTLYQTLLTLLRTEIPESARFTQPIQVHSYSGSFQMAKHWISVFPNIVFSFSHILTRKFPDAFQQLPMQYIAVETDAPYFPLGTQVTDFSGPGQIGMVAERLSRLCPGRLSWRELLEFSNENLRRLYP